MAWPRKVRSARAVHRSMRHHREIQPERGDNVARPLNGLPVDGPDDFSLEDNIPNSVIFGPSLFGLDPSPSFGLICCRGGFHGLFFPLFVLSVALRLRETAGRGGQRKGSPEGAAPGPPAEKRSVEGDGRDETADSKKDLNNGTTRHREGAGRQLPEPSFPSASELTLARSGVSTAVSESGAFGLAARVGERAADQRTGQ